MSSPVFATEPEIDPYAELDVTSSASQEEIKKAYLAQVRAHPPERDPGKFKRIRAAYDKLKTPEAKLETDMLRIEIWPAPELQTAAQMEAAVQREDVILAARALSDLARRDWRRDWREVNL